MLCPKRRKSLTAIHDAFFYLHVVTMFLPLDIWGWNIVVYCDYLAFFDVEKGWACNS